MEEAVKEKADGVSVAQIRIISVLETLPVTENNHRLWDHGYEPRSTLWGY
jgi:hypothetical protein